MDRDLIEVEDAPEVGHLYGQHPFLEDIASIFLRLAAETKVTTELTAKLIHLLSIFRSEQHGCTEVEGGERLADVYQIRHNLWRYTYIV